MIVGYARTSTVEQEYGLEAQHEALKIAGVERLFSEQVSSVVARAQLEAALDFVREGDSLVVTRLDRLARSTRDALAIVERLEAKGVALRVLDFAGSAVDTRSAQGKLILTMFAAFAEFERQTMLERQRSGIRKAKLAGKYKGRYPSARSKAQDVVRLHAEGKTATEIAKALGIGRASVYRLLPRPSPVEAEKIFEGIDKLTGGAV